jgi:phage major head subunit gpT-like protein
MTEFNRPTPETLPEKPQFEAITTRLDRIGAESGIEEMTNELYLYGVNVREDLGKEFNYYFHLTRNDTIEEVAVAIEKMRVFGGDAVSSFAIYIREMKK